MVKVVWMREKRNGNLIICFLRVYDISKGKVLRMAQSKSAPKLSVAFDLYLREHSLPRGNEVKDRATMAAPLRCFGVKRITAITKTGIDYYTQDRLAGKWGTPGRAPRKVTGPTIRREIIQMQAVVNFALRHMGEHQKVNFPKPADGRPRERWITEPQQDEILSHIDTAPLGVRIFLRLALTYGVRQGAIMDLRFGDQVDFLSETIDFNRPGARETRKRRPVVPMTKNIRADLEEAFCERGRGAAVCPSTTPRDFSKFMGGLGYSWVTPHVLKHSAITLMLRAGVAPSDVSKITRTDLRTIYKVYRHHTLDELRSIVDARCI